MLTTMYQCKPNKMCMFLALSICLLASLHQKKGKPETIEFYNKTKCGVDVADQMACQYSVKVDINIQ